MLGWSLWAVDGAVECGDWEAHTGTGSSLGTSDSSLHRRYPWSVDWPHRTQTEIAGDGPLYVGSLRHQRQFREGGEGKETQVDWSHLRPGLPEHSGSGHSPEDGGRAKGPPGDSERQRHDRSENPQIIGGKTELDGGSHPENEMGRQCGLCKSALCSGRFKGEGDRKSKGQS